MNIRSKGVSATDGAFIVQSIPLYLAAAKLTVKLALFGAGAAAVLGFAASLLLYYRVRWLCAAARVYIELARNTPLLIQLFFLYYGLAKIGVKLDAYTCAAAGLAFLGGGYMAESFRAGLEAVSKAQLEAGLSLGLSRYQLMRRVVLPQALAVAAPSIGANVIFLLKETSVVGAIALADLMFVAKDQIGMYYKTAEALLMLVAAYFILLAPLSAALRFFERRLRYAGNGDRVHLRGR